MLLMFERGIRGGITQVVRKYAAASNPYMGDKFNPNVDTTYLQYLDANNLYGWAMSQPLPTGGFKWVDVNPKEISELATRTDKGYILEVDVSYPKDLHDSHNDLPFMCERMEINGVEKLAPNLRDKKSLRYPHSSIESSATTRIEARWNPWSDRIRSIAMVKDLYRL